MSKPGLIALAALMVVGCAATVPLSDPVLEQKRWCRAMAAREGQWSSTAAGAAVVAGSEGIATIAVDEKGWRQALGVGVVVAAALAAYSNVRASSYSTGFKEGRCVEYLDVLPIASSASAPPPAASSAPMASPAGSQ